MLKLKITTNAYLKLKYFTENTDTEVSGLGKVRVSRGYLEVYDIEVFEQNVSAISSDLEMESLVKFLIDKTLKNESVKDYKVWWHSHVYMSAYFSPTDDTTINRSTEFPYLISIVTNKDEESMARLDLFKPLRLTIPLKIEISLNRNKKLEEKCKIEIAKKVKKQNILQSILEGKKRYLTRKYSGHLSQLPGWEILGHKQQLH